jgi:hypothetical protein
MAVSFHSKFICPIFESSEQVVVLKGHVFTGCKKLIPGCKKRQGTTSVVPQAQQNKCWALAPEGMLAPAFELIQSLTNNIRK